jgi:hypothetical protein
MRQPAAKSGPGDIRQDTTRTAKHIITNTEVGDSAMRHNTPQRTEASPTQLLRNLIEGNACGLVSPDELQDALTLLEQSLHLARTYVQVDEEVTA